MEHLLCWSACEQVQLAMAVSWLYAKVQRPLQFVLTIEAPRFAIIHSLQAFLFAWVRQFLHPLLLCLRLLSIKPKNPAKMRAMLKRTANALYHMSHLSIYEVSNPKKIRQTVLRPLSALPVQCSRPDLIVVEFVHVLTLLKHHLRSRHCCQNKVQICLLRFLHTIKNSTLIRHALPRLLESQITVYLSWSFANEIQGLSRASCHRQAQCSQAQERRHS